MKTKDNLHKLVILAAVFTILLSACAAPAATEARDQVETAGAQKVVTVEIESGNREEIGEAESIIVTAPAAPQAPAPLPTLAAVQPEGPVSGEPLTDETAPEFLGPPEVEEPAKEGAPIATQPVIEATFPSATPLPMPTKAPILPAPHPQNNYFENYGINPYIDPREDHLSTFAIDVDTASYAVARRYVMDGLLPPADAIRVEEFVNYFDPGYQTPEDVAFSVYADGAQSPFHDTGIHILRFGIQGYQVSEAERKPASLTFVIDVSGSMEMENRLGLVKQSLQLLVDRLRPTDTVAIVVYGSSARTVLNPTSAEDRSAILNAIYSLNTEGATNAEAGLRLGYQLAYQAYRPGASNRVILCSDGVANVGQTGPNAILEQIRGYADAGITLTSVGFGMGNFNDVLMEQLADNGDGHYAYVDTLDEANKLFVDDLTSTLQVIARDAKVQVDFNPDVVNYYRLIGYENRDIDDVDFRNDSVDAGEIGAGHSVVALYAVILHPSANGRIATVQFRWQNPDSLQVTEINGNYNTWDLSPSFQDAPLRYQLAVVVSQYAEILRLSPWAAGTSIGQILEQAVRISGQLASDSEVTQFASLVSRAAQIQTLIDWR